MILSLKILQRAIANPPLKGAFYIAIIIAVILSNLFLVDAQNLRPEMVAAELYKNLKDFPPENQHISSKTGEVASENTLVSRIIRYHQFVKNRPVEYRLDWKLTLADYLGVNETINQSSYPGNTTLKNNPLESDRAAISNLDRIQRNELVDTLVRIYNPQSVTSGNSEFSPSSTPSSDTGDLQKIPQRGGADLLKLNSKNN